MDEFMFSTLNYLNVILNQHDIILMISLASIETNCIQFSSEKLSRKGHYNRIEILLVYFVLHDFEVTNRYTVQATRDAL